MRLLGISWLRHHEEEAQRTPEATTLTSSLSELAEKRKLEPARPQMQKPLETGANPKLPGTAVENEGQPNSWGVTSVGL